MRSDFSRNDFYILVSLHNVLVLLIGYRRNHLWSRYFVNGEQGCREIEFVSVIRMTCRTRKHVLAFIGGFALKVSSGILLSRKGKEVVERSLVNLIVG